MKKIIFLLINFIFCMNLYSVEFRNDKQITLAFLNQFQLLKDFSDARESLATWLENIARKRNVDMKVKFYASTNKLYQDFKDKKVDMIVVDAEFFFKMKSEISSISKDLWSLAYEENREYKYCLVGNKKQKFTTMNDLKNKTMIKKSYDVTGDDWLDYMAVSEAKTLNKNLLKEIKREPKESTVLLNVFFNKYDYGLIRKNTWNTMIELNPSIKKNVNLIKCSNVDFVPFIGFFRKDIDDYIVKIFYDTAGKLSNFADSEQIFSLLNFDHVFQLEDKRLEELTSFYKEFEMLKGKYN